MWKSRCVGVVRCVGAVVVVLWTLLAVVSAQGSNTSSKWQTLSGDAPLVIARGGFSGLLPDSSITAYSLALLTSLPNVLLWCDVQLTKDGAGICFPNINLNNASDVANVFKGRNKVYLVNGVPTQGWFSVDFTVNELASVSLTQGIYSRTNKFDGNVFQILTVQDVAKQLQQPRLWLNIQHDAFYTQHNLSMRSFVLSVSRTVIVDYISSPEVSFLRSIVARFKPGTTKLVFRFLRPTDIEPSTNQSYGSLLSNLTFIKTFASGILVPKAYIWPVDVSLYLQPHTSLVSDAHKEGLEVFASDFVNDLPLSYNYSSDPVNECLQFIDNGNFSVDGVLSDFPITPSATVDCFAHMAKNASKQVDVLVISQNGASGDYPGCTDLAYSKAISDGVDVLDCPVQMSEDGIPFCLGSINLIDSTTVAQSSFSNLTVTIPEIKNSSGIYTFNLTWSQIQKLTPTISNPYSKYDLFRNPKFKNAGKFMTLSDFLAMTKNVSSLYGVLISIENAEYLAENQISSVPNAVLDALNKAGYDKQKSMKVMIQSSDSSVLKMFKEKSNYELVYQVGEDIHDALNSTIQDIKDFANSVVVSKSSVFTNNVLFLTGVTKVAPRLQSFNLNVYVETFNNEFVSQAWDFFSDATVEINTYYEVGGINGVITDFPRTSARYKRNRCLSRGNSTPNYMAPVQPGSLIQLITADYLPPAEAPFPVLTEEDVAEPPFPLVSGRPPTSSPSGGSAKAPSQPNAQPKIAACVFLSSVAMLLAALLLF